MARRETQRCSGAKIDDEEMKFDEEKWQGIWPWALVKIWRFDLFSDQFGANQEVWLIYGFDQSQLTTMWVFDLMGLAQFGDARYDSGQEPGKVLLFWPNFQNRKRIWVSCFGLSLQGFLDLN